jgi:hypothetical protein
LILDCMTKRRVGALMLILGFAGGALLVRDLLVDELPSGVDVRRTGFAIWPQDTVEEARAACSRQGSSASAVATAERFASSFLATKDPAFWDVAVDPPTARVSLQDPSIGSELYFGVALRKLDRCWYVTSVQDRNAEMTEEVTAGYAGPERNRKMWVNIRPDPYSGHQAFRGEIGLGGATRRVDSIGASPDGTAQFTLPVPDAERPSGHFIVSDAESPAEAGFGAPVGSPPTLAGRVLPPTGKRSRRAVGRAARAENDCGFEYWTPGERARATVHAQLGTWPGRLSRRTLKKQPNGDWSVAADGVRATFDFWRVRKGCWLLGRIQPTEGSERVESVSVVNDRFVFDLRWGRAEEAYLEFGFGFHDTYGMVRRIRGPIVVMDDDYPPGVRLGRRRLGHYQVVFYRGGRVVNVEGGALPPLAEWS